MLPTHMDVLVAVGDVVPPPRLAARAHRVLRLPEGLVDPTVVAEVRSHVGRLVGVIGPPVLAVRVADALHRAGLPTLVFSDDPLSVAHGVEVWPVTDRGPAMAVADSLLDLIGDTPMVRLDRTGRELSCHLLAKLEYLNPGGSVKDRPAVLMVEAAEAAGLLGPGGTIVEPTSGNTGVGLALVAAQRGYRCVFTMPDKIAAEKIQLLRAFGAEVVVCPTAVAPEHPESYYSVADQITAATAGAFQPNQYRNAANPLAHERSTGPEIWRQTAGRVTHFVAGIGTGGTISGVGRYLKAQNPAVRIVGADPEGSVYSGGGGRPYLVEGIGEDFWPTTYDPSVVDTVVAVSDRDSFLTARRVTRDEGLLIGGSGGTAIWAALQIGRELGGDDVIVVLVPDSGRGYLSKLFDDQWLADHGFVQGRGSTVASLLAAKGETMPALVHVHPDETVRAAISVLKEYGISQMPVVKAEPPLALAEVVGTVSDRLLLDLALHVPGAVERPVASVMEPALPMVGTGETLDNAAARLQDRAAVLVLDGGHPVGILTRSDLLSFLARE